MSVKTYKFYMFEVGLNIISMECVSMGFFSLIMFVMYQLTLKTAEKIFGYSVIIRLTLS